VLQTYPALLVAALVIFSSACAHEVIVLEPAVSAPEATPAQRPSDSPLPFTVSVLSGSFDRCRRLRERVVLERFAVALREARLFQGVLFPVPADIRPPWEIKILAADSVSEPNSNLWKAFFATLIPPTAFFLKLENDYALELEALLLENRVLVGTYRGEARIRHRYGRYANRTTVNAEGADVVLRTASEAALSHMRADLERIRKIAF
jgi:hypothetical protein